MDLYKGILILIVVVGHCLSCSVSDKGGVLYNFIWCVQMPGFMLVAGYFSVKEENVKHVLFSSLKKKCRQYLLPCFSWMIIIDILLLGKNDRNVIKGLSSWVYQTDSGLWFLWVVFVLGIFASILNILRQNDVLMKLLPTIAIIFSFNLLWLIIGYFKGISFLGIQFIVFYGLFYFSGYLFRVYEGILTRIFDNTVVVFLSFAVFLVIVFNYDVFTYGSKSLLGLIIRAIAGFTGCFTLYSIVRSYEERLVKTGISIIGVYTLEIYVLHVRYTGLMSEHNYYSLYSIPGFANFMITCFFTVVLTWITYYAFKSNSLTDLLFFGKRKN